MDNIIACPATLAAFVILFDIVTGYYQAWCNHCIESKRMKKGLQRKGAEVLLIIFILVANVYIEHNPAIQAYPDVANLIQFMSLDGVCAYITIKELTSICENLGRANPELAGLPLMQHMLSNKEITEQHDKTDQADGTKESDDHEA